MDAADVKPGKKKSKLMMIIVGVVVLGAAGAGVFFFLGNRTNAAALDAGKDGKDGKDAAAKSGPKQIVIRDPLVVNLRWSTGMRYLRVRMGFEVSNAAVVNEITANDNQINDWMSERLANCSIKQTDSVVGRNQLKRELCTGINDLLHTGVVDRIYFTEFVVQ